MPGSRKIPVASLGAAATLEVAEDGSEARLQLGKRPRERSNADTAPLVVEELQRMLADAGIVAGIDSNTLQELAVSALTSTDEMETLIARQIEPRSGVGGRFITRFQTEFLPGAPLDGDRTDFRERSLYVRAEEGQLLAVYEPPREGSPGQTVTGEPIEAPAPDSCLPQLGEGVALVGGRRIVAVIGGVISWTPDSFLDVSDALIHEGDVDLHSGNLRSNGSIFVKGTVEEEMELEATRDVGLQGNVDGGSITAGGSVSIVGSLFGQGKGEIRAGGDVALLLVRYGRVRAGGVLTLGKEASDGLLEGREVICEKPKTRIVGGTVRARDRMVLGNVGTDMGAKTILHLDETFGQETGAAGEEAELEALRAKASNALEGGRDHLGSGKSRRNAALLDKDNELKKAQERHRLDEWLKTAYIDIRGTLEPTCEVRIGKRVFIFETSQTAVRIRFDPRSTQLLIEPL